MISIVEMLGQDETWSASQELILGKLAKQARKSEIGSMSEKEEIAIAIEKSLYRLSLRQGVRRLLNKTGMQYLASAWDDLYAERSKIVHSNEPNQQAFHAVFAGKAKAICGRILIGALGCSISVSPEDLDRRYPLKIGA
ncbi:MAG: hypothetical protein H0W48_01490 [Methylibium sp.]|nr:hypothetical protein [Methylibium sp.]